MIEQLHVLKTAVVNTEAFRNSIRFQQGKRKSKSLLDFYILQKNTKVFLRTLCAFSILVYL